MSFSYTVGPSLEEVVRRNPKAARLLSEWGHIIGHVKGHQGGDDPRNGPEGGLFSALDNVFGSGSGNWEGNKTFHLVTISLPNGGKYQFAIAGKQNVDKYVKALVDPVRYSRVDDRQLIEYFNRMLLPLVNQGAAAFAHDFERMVRDYTSKAEQVYDSKNYGKFVEDVKNLSPDFIKSVNELLEFLRRTNRLDLWPFYWSHNLTPGKIDPMLFSGPDGLAEFIRTVDSLRNRFFDGPGLVERKPTPEDLARAKEAGFKLEEVYDTPEALAEALAKLDELYAKKFTHFSKFGYQNLSQDDYELAVTDPDKFDEKLKYYRPQMTDAEKAQQQAYEEALRMGSQILGGGVTISSAGAASVQDQIAKLQEAAANIQNKTQNQIQGGGNNDNNNNS